MRRVLAGLLVAMVLAGITGAGAQTAPVPVAATGLVSEPEAVAEDMSGMTMGVLQEIERRYGEIVETAEQAPPEVEALGAAAGSALMSGSGVRTATYLLIMLMVGIGLEWYYWTYAIGALRAIRAIAPRSPRHAVLFGLRRLSLTGFGLILFTLATIGATAAFDWPPGVHDIVVTVTLMIVAVRLAFILAETLLAPRDPQLRLLPLGTSRARLAAIGVLVLSMLAALAWFAPPLMGRVSAAPHAAEALRLVLGSVIAALVLLAANALLGASDRRRARRERGRLPHFPRALAASFLIVATYALWLAGHGAAALVLATVSLMVALQTVLHAVVFHFWRDQVSAKDMAELAAGDTDADAPEEPVADAHLAPSIVLPAVRLVLILVALAISAAAIDMPLTGMAMSGSPLAAFGIRLLGVAALALLADVAWIAIRSTIDHRLASVGPALPHGTAGASSRLLTLLPLLRTCAAVVIVVLLVLSALWTLGIEITPLLAGAGIVGLAFGFGAQSLVKDVISGVFLLAEDVFRVGEYIESGSSTKGTVEKITLRTVALRHHNGPLHFVPYGTLGTVRNTSRDWVIEKFNLPLPIEVDSEKVRKLIKKVGEEMLLDEEVGPLIIEPLKGKLYRIDPGVKIFRCKFRTAPGNQFAVRALAYKKIELAMAAAGISYADSGLLPRTSEAAALAANGP